MAIFLVHHGKCRPKDQDPGKGLSGVGCTDTKKIAEGAKAYSIPVSYLTTGSMDFKIYRFQNSGILCLDQAEDETWTIKWTLNPDIS